MFKKLSFDYNVYLLIDDNVSVEIEADDHWQITVRSEMLDHLYSLEQKFDIDHAERILAIPNSGWKLVDEDFEYVNGTINRRDKKKGK